MKRKSFASSRKSLSSHIPHSRIAGKFLIFTNAINSLPVPPRKVNVSKDFGFYSRLPWFDIACSPSFFSIFEGGSGFESIQKLLSLQSSDLSLILLTDPSELNLAFDLINQWRHFHHPSYTSLKKKPPPHLFRFTSLHPLRQHLTEEIEMQIFRVSSFSGENHKFRHVSWHRSSLDYNKDKKRHFICLAFVFSRPCLVN